MNTSLQTSIKRITKILFATSANKNPPSHRLEEHIHKLHNTSDNDEVGDS